MADEPTRDSLTDPALSEAARTSLHRFRIAFEPLRPELFRYCRHLTRNAWDAEDLVQDTMARAFVMLGSQYGQHIEHPRSWMFRVASNLWIDRVRRVREELRPPDELGASAVRPDPQATREAAGTLIAQLSPQERVAVVLKDAFDLALDEIADVLGTTVGAVKSALQRGRGKLMANEPDTARVPTPAAIDAFCAAFNAGDLTALTALLLDSTIIELPGVAVDLGLAASRKVESGILYHSLLEPLSAGVAPGYLEGYIPTTPPRAEVRLHRGEHLVLLWYAHDGGDAVRCFTRLELDPDGDRIAYVRQYYYSPDALAEVAGELDVPYRSNGYGS